MAWYFALFIDGHPSSKVEGAKEFLGTLQTTSRLGETPWTQRDLSVQVSSTIMSFFALVRPPHPTAHFAVASGKSHSFKPGLPGTEASQFYSRFGMPSPARACMQPNKKNPTISPIATFFYHGGLLNPG